MSTVTVTAPTAEKLTYAQAITQAVTLRKQGLTYPAIAEHLAKLGYTSPKTRAPLKEMAVRLMVTQAENREKETQKEDTANEAADLSDAIDAASLRSRVRILADLAGFSAEQRLTLILAVVNEGGRDKAGATKT